MPSAAPREVDLRVGGSVGPYRLEQLLGEGGMGHVFRARRSDSDSPVALKVVKPQFAADPAYAQRFVREAQAAREVVHPNLVGVIDVGENDGCRYLVMPFMEGESLAQRLKRAGRLAVSETLRLVAEVAAGLDALHVAGLVHRDVKPANVLLDADGTATLADFGLAKGPGYAALTGPGQVVGTLDYLAPELIRGQPATATSDVYALGCVAYECLAGRPPFGGRGMFEVGMAVLEEQPPDPCADRDDAPAQVSQVVLTALSKDPGQRPSGAGAFAGTLASAAGAGA